MAWSASLTSGSAPGEKTTFTPDTSAEGGYTVSSFTAPQKGVYRFELSGSGGTKGLAVIGNQDITTRKSYEQADGGEGGRTDGYLLLEKGQTVYVGAGGTCSAAFVSGANGSSLAAIAKGDLLFVAGGGGAGGSFGESNDTTGYNCYATQGGDGGGSSGAEGEMDNLYPGGGGGTQSAGGQPNGQYDGTTGGIGNAGAYGTGGARVSSTYETYIAISGRGGDGLYGGGSGHSYAHWGTPYSARGYGGGGGSGYVKTATLSVNSKTYTSETSQSGGAAPGTNGSVIVTLYARSELPVRFDMAMVEQIIFNGTNVGSLIYNGTKVFMRRLRRCLRYPGGQSGCRAATRASFTSLSMACR